MSLTKWFKEDWIDIKTGEKCGRKSAKNSKRPYPACRPKAVADRMSISQKRSVAKKKTSKERVEYPITASGKKRLKIKK
tara:strand:- start:1043 stop:1279 length:237 start_codon:yes stop_codon:yes gene_type:complete